MLIFLSMLDTPEERDKFTRLYETWRYLMYYVAKDILKDSDLAEDAVQEAFLTLIRHMEQVESVDSPRTKRFLVTITKSRAIDLLRRRRADEVEYEDALGDDALGYEDVEEQFFSKEDYHRIVDGIRRLDENYRIVLECRYLHELSERETADLLGVSQKTVSVRSYRAKQKLREMLQVEAGGMG
jgi:RNA polymerase sigma-70 factor (ECF subfamily)